MRSLLAVIVSFGIAHPASAQSFNCAKATTRVEKMICADNSLKELDEYLGRYYSAARSELAGAESCLQADQAQWLKSTRDACADNACLKTAYLNRLGELDALQPGVTAIKNIELPRTPALVSIIPPAADRTAAPPKPAAKPLEVTGTLVNDVAQGDGFLVRDKDGKSFPLVLLMFLEGKSQEQLENFARDKNSTFRARGYAAVDGARTYFEPSRCTFVHRLPAASGGGCADDQDMEKQLERVRKKVVTQGKVCAEPDKPCAGFKPNELSFAIGTPFKFDRGRDKSQAFYAVILQSAPICKIADEERLKAQKAFPGAKVFLHRYFCEDFGDKVTYSNINEKVGFVAVYAGDTEADARKVLAQAKAAGYADANFRRMEAIVVYQLE